MKLLTSFLAGSAALLAAGELKARQMQDRALAHPGCRELLAHMKIVDVADVHGNPHPTLVISGVNVQIVSGDDNQESPLHVGNLVVGHSAAPTGSHNLLLGAGAQALDSYSCLVAGGEVTGSESCAVVGFGFISNGSADVVLGGVSNSIQYSPGTPHGRSVIVGGSGNLICSGRYNAIVGGLTNQILSQGVGNALVGGSYNNIGNETALCSDSNGAFYSCSIFGGEGNWIHAKDFEVTGATIGGGRRRDVMGDHDWRAGDLFTDF